jgi:hypothetical protein
MIYETVNEIYLFSYSFILDCLRWIRQINRRFYPALHIVIKVMAQHFHCCSSFDSHSRVFNYQQTLKWVCFIIFMHCLFVYKYCYSDSRKLWAVMKGGGVGALKSDSTHDFFRNACTKSGSLRFSQFSGCWLILSVYIPMCFDFPFVRLLGVR